MTRSVLFSECLDFVQYKISHFPFRREQVYCFIVRDVTLLLTNRRFLRPKDFILHSFRVSHASDVLLERLDINIAIVATDFILKCEQDICPLDPVSKINLGCI